MPEIVRRLADRGTGPGGSGDRGVSRREREAFPVVKASGLHPVPFEFWNKGNSEAGKKLYHQIGCVACHAADADYETVEIKPSPLDQLLEQLDPQELAEMGLAAKARRDRIDPAAAICPRNILAQSLTFFLLDPEKTRPAGRMPSLKLEPVEAADIAAYLLRRSKAESPTAIARSRSKCYPRRPAVVCGTRVLHCHVVSGINKRSAAKLLSNLEADSEICVLRQSPARAAIFRLGCDANRRDQNRIGGFLQTSKTSAADRLSFQLLQLNCYACHERENQGGVGRYRRPFFETVGHVDIGDEGRLATAANGSGPQAANRVDQSSSQRLRRREAAHANPHAAVSRERRQNLAGLVCGSRSSPQTAARNRRLRPVRIDRRPAACCWTTAASSVIRFAARLCRASSAWIWKASQAEFSRSGSMIFC